MPRQANTAKQHSPARSMELRAGQPLRIADPAKHAELVARSGEVAKRCAPSTRVYAEATGISEDRARYHFRGDPHAAICRALELVEDLARDPRCSALPLIAELEAIAFTREIAGQTTDALVARYHALTDQEDVLEAEETAATRRLAHGGCALRATRAGMDESRLEAERSEVLAILTRRGVNPFTAELRRAA